MEYTLGQWDYSEPPMRRYSPSGNAEPPVASEARCSMHRSCMRAVHRSMGSCTRVPAAATGVSPSGPNGAPVCVPVILTVKATSPLLSGPAQHIPRA
jgi:hypothetical protein